MGKDCLHQRRVDELLSQDLAVSSFQFEEFRMTLEKAIRRFEQQMQLIRRASLCGLAVFISCVLSVPLLESCGLFNKVSWLRMAWCGCGVIAMLATGVLSGIYQYRYQPALGRAEKELQSMRFALLQQQIAELSRKLENP